MTLEWLPPKDDGGAPVTDYKVEMTLNQDVWTEVTVTENTKAKVKNLTTDKKHYFRVSAINKVGVGKPLESDGVVPKRKQGIVCVSVCLLVPFCHWGWNLAQSVEHLSEVFVTGSNPL